jgi:hypothetical protein
MSGLCPLAFIDSDADAAWASYAGKLVTGLGKGGGVSVTVRADHTSI